MAIETIPPWIRSPDTLRALSSGASAGASAARLEQEGVSESARLALEAQRMSQSAAFEQDQLKQQALQHQMEFQARQKLAEQNQLRDQQQLNIENAYKTAQLGVAQGRLQEAQKIAEDKARAAALTFQREQAFAKDVASGIPVMEAYRRNPVSPSLLNSVERTQTKVDTASKPVVREGKFPILTVNPSTGEVKQVYTPEQDAGILSQTQREQLKDLRHQRDLLEKNPPFKKSEQPTYEKKLQDIQNQISGITTMHSTGTSTAKQKVIRAHAISIAHPDWTKEQIIDAVNKEMK